MTLSEVLKLKRTPLQRAQALAAAGIIKPSQIPAIAERLKCRSAKTTS